VSGKCQWLLLALAIEPVLCFPIATTISVNRFIQSVFASSKQCVNVSRCVDLCSFWMRHACTFASFPNSTCRAFYPRGAFQQSPCGGHSIQTEPPFGYCLSFTSKEAIWCPLGLVMSVAGATVDVYLAGTITSPVCQSPTFRVGLRLPPSYPSGIPISG